VTTARRPYDSPVRRRQAAETRDRIVAAGAELVHELPSWDWSLLTFRAVAERAGVGERTVYRHFPTERLLHDAVMQRLEEEAGVSYEGIGVGDLAPLAARIFASLGSYAASERGVDDPR
jgi:AcrR family transcriptional regulator